MASKIGPLKPEKTPSGPSPLTAEQRYWKSFKNQLLIPSPTSFAITYISRPSNAFTNNDTFAVTSGTRIQIYSARTRKLTKTITRFQDVARSGDIRRDGRILVAGEDTGRIQVFDIGSRAVLKTWAVHKQPVWVTRFSPTELTTVLSASDDKTVKLWDLPSGEPTNNFFGHSDYVRCAGFIPASTSHLIASGSYDSTVKVWDPRSGSAVMTFKHPAPVEDVLPLASGTTILAASGNTISVIDMVAARPFQLMSNHQKTVTSLSLASRGQRLISGGLDGHVKVYETTGWSVVSTAKYHSPILAISMIGSGDGVDYVDRHLVVGMSSGVLSMRTRLGAKEAARERQREKTMAAIVSGDAEHHEARLAKRKREKSEKQRLELVGEGAEIILGEELGPRQQKRERPWHKKLRRGAFASALDDLLDVKGPDHSPANILTLLLALRHRGAIREALSGRDETSVQPILRWICNHMFDTRYTSICIEVGLHLLELYSDYISYSADLREGFRTLHRRVKIEVERAQVAWQTSGAIESLMNSTAE